ncbi:MULTISPECIES: energy-coupled thiamine transporter ThiT [Psychrobacillus]|uniref:Energy-coupled thiamine transporter ThiT n=1 Tax=Psychrobacillus faecigallinarum TaxID=2762235 RepID=A0ABR8REN7_9BACI|nr:energy-coupled thiamine transporter ThiT [Psychrobacillus faecigallinarum]MBD7946221.1 energy-coupled thiamine transporter ThiT [Psychrobacillus faecigallinarum]QGM29092.1 energy-coupled thiamine transporter ThiT [Bacillus sp. N3536]
MRNQRVVLLVEIAIFAALGYILDLIGFGMPQGGSVTFVLVPIILIAFRRGIVAGVVTGFLIGLLQVVTGRFYPAPLSFEIVVIQVGIDYFIAFMVAGLAGLLRPAYMKAFENQNKKKMAIAIVIGALIASFLRYLAHVLSGILFFGEFAEGENVILYSLIYNSTYMIPVFLFAAFICAILFVKAPRLLMPNS